MNGRSARPLALYGFLGSGNIGNDASFETVLHWWRSHHPEIALECITIAPEAVEARYGVRAKRLAWRPRRESRHQLGRFIQLLFGRVLDLIRTFGLAGSAAAVIVPGMGVLESSLGTEPWGLPGWLFALAVACWIRDCPLILLDVGADVAENRAIRWLNARTVQLASHLSYRDRGSADAMATLVSREPDAVAHDLAFAHSAGRVSRPEPGRLVVGVMAYYGPTDDPVAGAGIHQRYVAGLVEAICRLVRDGMHVVLVGGDRADEAVANAVRSGCRTLDPDMPEDAVQIRRCTTFSELTEEVARAEVAAVSRFHNLIAALRVGRPTVSLGYAPKSRHLMQTMGLGGYCLDLVDLDASSLVSLVSRARAHRQQLTRVISATSTASAADVERLLKDVGEFVMGAAVVTPASSAREWAS